MKSDRENTMLRYVVCALVCLVVFLLMRPEAKAAGETAMATHSIPLPNGQPGATLYCYPNYAVLVAPGLAMTDHGLGASNPSQGRWVMYAGGQPLK